MFLFSNIFQWPTDLTWRWKNVKPTCRSHFPSSRHRIRAIFPSGGLYSSDDPRFSHGSVVIDIVFSPFRFSHIIFTTWPYQSPAYDKGATIRLPGRHGFFFWTKYSSPGFGQNKYSGLDHLWTKYFGSIHWKINVCPLSMKRKCLPSKHEYKMSALYTCTWYYHGSRTDLIFVSLSCPGLDRAMSAAKFELHCTELHCTLYVVSYFSYTLTVWTCIHVLEEPQIKYPLILNWENNKIEILNYL